MKEGHNHVVNYHAMATPMFSKFTLYAIYPVKSHQNLRPACPTLMHTLLSTYINRFIRETLLSLETHIEVGLSFEKSSLAQNHA